MTARLSTCGRCGGTIEWYESANGPNASGHQWRHVAATPGGHTHNPDPDDGYVSGPGRDDLPACTGCGHPQHTDDEELCEERIGTGLYGSDGVEVTDWCRCTGPAPAASSAAPDPWFDPDAASAAEPPPF